MESFVHVYNEENNTINLHSHPSELQLKSMQGIIVVLTVVYIILNISILNLFKPITSSLPIITSYKFLDVLSLLYYFFAPLPLYYLFHQIEKREKYVRLGNQLFNEEKDEFSSLYSKLSQQNQINVYLRGVVVLFLVIWFVYSPWIYMLRLDSGKTLKLLGYYFMFFLHMAYIFIFVNFIDDFITFHMLEINTVFFLNDNKLTIKGKVIIDFSEEFALKHVINIHIIEKINYIYSQVYFYIETPVGLYAICFISYRGRTMPLETSLKLDAIVNYLEFTSRDTIRHDINEVIEGTEDHMHIYRILNPDDSFLLKRIVRI